MADAAHDWTDEQIERLRRRFRREYSAAEKDMRGKLDKFLADYDKQNREWKQKVRSGKAKQDEYDAWLKEQAMNREWLGGMVSELSADALRTDQIAMAYINDEIPLVFAENANRAAHEVETGIGRDTHSFDLYDRDTVGRLIAEDSDLLPPLPQPKVNVRKDLSWNARKMRSAITQSVLQGESVPHAAERLMRVFKMDEAVATRTARTALTGAENAGRVHSYERAKSIGINLEQEWMATLDQRTRHSHRQLDGQHVPVGKPFKVDGIEINFPADPTAPAEYVYNCRCTLVAWFPDIEQEDNDRWSDLPKDMSYDDWKNGKIIERQRKQAAGVVDGKNILATWQRRQGEYEFAIRDAINAQGFDGKPRVVGQKEFEDAVKDANGGSGLVLGRGYTAPNQETLDSYRESLYEGDWYVDCSSGRSTYGRGMYCFANTSGDIGAGEQAAQTYAKPKRGNTVGYSEVMTLDKSARIIDIEDLFDERFEATRELDEEKRKFINTEVEDNAVAVLLGYDAVYVPERDIMIVLNRTKLIIRRPK